MPSARSRETVSKPGPKPDRVKIEGDPHGVVDALLGKKGKAPPRKVKRRKAK